MSIFDFGSISTNFRDWAHATKIFVDGNYQLAPKFGFLYYVHIETNVLASEKSEIGMLVKSAQLPKFNVDLKKQNVYNRYTYVQTKLNYEPVTITFHDDNSNKVRNFWLAYFKHYYRDADNTEQQMGAMATAKYDQDMQYSNWGYMPPSPTPFLKKITIYSLNKKRYSSYALINPTISNFQHGEHSYASSETMTNSMTITYESVLYGHGKVTEKKESKLPGFQTLYDIHPSPLTPAGGGTASILGQGGLADTADEIGSDIEDGNYGAALFKGIQGANNLSKMDLKKAASSEAVSLGKDVLRGNNASNSVFIPSVAAATAGAKTWISDGAGKVFNSSKQVNRVNQEVTSASASQLPQTPSSPLPARGSFSLTTNAIQSSTNLTNQLNTSNVNSTTSIDSETLLDQALQGKQPTNQFIVNESQLLTTLRYNLSAAHQHKIDLQVKMHKIKDQQQMIDDAIISLTTKKDSLINDNANEMLVKQLSLQIEYQQTAIIENDQLIANFFSQLSQLDKRIELINARIIGLT
jgi:hypothetical protein